MLRFSFLVVINIDMEQEQFKKEVLPSRGKLLSYARRLLDDSDDAEDVVQEVLLKLWYMRDELDHYHNIMALSVQITKHLCLNRIKAYERKQEELSDTIFVSDLPTPYMLLEQKDDMKQVMRIIERLPGLQQTILRMKHVDGLEVEDIAQLIGSTPEAIRMNLSRARKRVKELFLKMQV